jgi:outer membrane biosynthesis protein TonB
MYVETEDWRPGSALKRQPPSGAELVAGAITAFGAPAAVFLVVGTFATVAAVLDLGESDPTIRERNVVEAQFVKLGKERDPNKLPNRDVPIKETAPPDKTHVSKNPDKPEVQPDAGKPPPDDAVEDPLRRLSDRAQEFAEIAKKREQEGSPEGIPGGTASEAKAGDKYAGKLYAFFRRGWTVPTIISDKERKKLTAEVDIQIGENRHIKDVQLRKESGNPLFDQSVLNRIKDLQESNAKLPEPPDEVADQYLGQTIGLRFRGKDAN